MPQRSPSPRIHVAPEESGRFVLRLAIIALIGYLALHIDFLAIASSLLLGTYFASRMIAKRSLAGIEIALSTQQLRTRSGDAVDARLTLRNRNRTLPIHYPALSVKEKDTSRIQVFQYRGVIPPGKSVTLRLQPSLHNRGLRRLEAFAPRSRFPFGLHQATAPKQSHATANEIVVWPRAEPLDVDSLLNDPPPLLYETLGNQTLHLHDTETSRIRDYQAGDPKPRINWKLSAKLDKLTVLEPRAERRERYELHLETDLDLWPNPMSFERMLRLVTSLVSELSRRKLIKGITLDGVHFELLTSRQQVRFFDALAVAQPRPRNGEGPVRRARRRHLWILPAPKASIMLSPAHASVLERSESR